MDGPGWTDRYIHEGTRVRAGSRWLVFLLAVIRPRDTAARTLRDLVAEIRQLDRRIAKAGGDIQAARSPRAEPHSPSYAESAS